MIHAAAELVEAMTGIIPHDRSGLEAACGAEYDEHSRHHVWAFNPTDETRYELGSPMEKRRFEDVFAVTCPACLALMDSARGEQRTADLLVHADALMERAS